MAVIKVVYGGKKTYGGYLSIDGGIYSKIYDGEVFKVDKGNHYIKYVSQLKNEMVYLTEGYVNSDINVLLEDDDIITFTIVSDDKKNILDVPSYEIRKMSDNEISSIDDEVVSGFTSEMNGELISLRKEFIICLFLGLFGVHKFIKGKFIMGLLYLFSLGLVGIGWLIDLISILIKINGVKKSIKRVQG